MKNYTKILCGALAAAMVLTTAAVPASAAAKPALNKTKLTLTVGQTATLKVKNAAKKETVKWASKKKAVASVTSKGKVTAKKKGTTVISATLKKAGKTLKCNVTVKAAAAETPAASTTQAQDITALMAGKSYKGTADAMGTTMDVLSLTFASDGSSYTVTGQMLDTTTLKMQEIGGTYTATLDGKTVTVTVTTPTGTEVTETLTVVKDDFSELSATKTVSGMDIPVTVVAVTEGE
jgi:hypothetical protein